MVRNFEMRCLLCMVVLLVVASGCAPKKIQRPIVGEISDVLPYVSGDSFSMRDSSGTVTHFTFQSESRSWFETSREVDDVERKYELEQQDIWFAGDDAADSIHFRLRASTNGSTNELHVILPLASFGLEVSPGNCPFGAVACNHADTIGGIVYDNVYHHDNGDSTNSTAGVSELMYNPSVGLLKVEWQFGRYWELLP